MESRIECGHREPMVHARVGDDVKRVEAGLPIQHLVQVGVDLRRRAGSLCHFGGEVPRGLDVDVAHRRETE